MDKPWGFSVILLFIFLQAMDVVTTSVLLAKDGFREANPIMRVVVYNLPVFIGVKAAFVALVLWVNNWAALVGATVITAAVVFNNARLMWRS